MKVFISWSGTKSKYIAETLSNWLEQVLQVAEPWISTDIEKGKRWSSEIEAQLNESKVAIICLTNDNLDSKWIHFEAGAIAKNTGAFVCTFLHDVNPANVQQPLSQFQHTKNTKSDILRLVKTINKEIGKNGGKSLKEKNIEGVFETFWSKLEQGLKKAPEDSKDAAIRSDRELLEELLQTVRSLKSDLKPQQQDERLLQGIIDNLIEAYAIEKRIDLNSTDLDGHQKEILKYIIRQPDIKILFESKDQLKKYITLGIDNLLPF